MRHLQKAIAVPGLAAVALLASVALAQPDQPNRLPSERLGEPPTVQDRIVEEAGANADTPRPVSGHTTMEAPPELVALVRREPDQFIGRDLVLDDGVNAVTVGPVLALRKRVLDQEPYLIVDATSYFNAPTQYAIAVKDLDRIEAGKFVMPEATGMHLRGFEYYPGDFTELESTEEVLAEQAEADAISEATEGNAEDPGVIPLKRF